MSSRLHPDILHRLDTGSLLVLPTSRAASELRRVFDTRQRESKLPSWELANVQSWNQWTQSLWTGLVLNGTETRLLLNPTQEQSLWEEVIRLDKARNGLGSPHALATLARSGFQRAAAYNAIGRLRATAITEDSRIFSEWSDAFIALCRKRDCISPSLLESILLRAVESGALPAQPATTFTACRNLTPAQQSLLDTLGASGTDILHLPLATEANDRDHEAATLQTEHDELLYAARWIRARLEAAMRDGHATKIALLVPDLATTHTQIERVLRDTLAPELHSIGEDISSTPWEMSTGASLATLSMIADALDLARWAAGALPIERVSQLLLSPHLGIATNRNQSARFDTQTLRRLPLLRPEIDLATLLQPSSKIDSPQWLRTSTTKPSVPATSLARAATQTGPGSSAASPAPPTGPETAISPQPNSPSLKHGKACSTP